MAGTCRKDRPRAGGSSWRWCINSATRVGNVRSGTPSCCSGRRCSATRSSSAMSPSRAGVEVWACDAEEVRLNPDETYWNYVGNGEIRVQQCASCGQRGFPRSEVCHVCLSEESSWEQIELGGTLVSFFVVRYPARAREELPVPCVVGHADLDAGARFSANVLDISPDAVAIGMRLRLELRDGIGGTLPQFVPE